MGNILTYLNAKAPTITVIAHRDDGTVQQYSLELPLKDDSKDLQPFCDLLTTAASNNEKAISIASLTFDAGSASYASNESNMIEFVKTIKSKMHVSGDFRGALAIEHLIIKMTIAYDAEKHKPLTARDASLLSASRMAFIMHVFNAKYNNINTSDETIKKALAPFKTQQQ